MPLRPAGFPRRVVVALAFAVLAASCSESSADDAADTDPVDGVSAADAAPVDGAAGGVQAATVGSLLELLPAETRGVFGFDVERLLTDADDVEVAFSHDAATPIVGDAMAAIGRLAEPVGLDNLGAALLVHTTDAEAGPALVAGVDPGRVDGLTDGVTAEGLEIRVLAEGVIAIGRPAAVDALPGGAGPLTPYLAALDSDAPITFVLGLPALVGDVTPDRSLRGAQALSGSFRLEDGALAGELAFHTDNASTFVDTYNALDRHAAGVGASSPLSVAAPLVGGLEQVVVPVADIPLDPSPAEAEPVTNLFKKLFIGMEAHEYAESVVDGGAPWFDLIGKSEADGDDPPSPASVWFRWRFKDEATLTAFEENELPEGYRVAPTRFLETDDPDGEYFFMLNIYNAGGGSIVGGARAEWDVYVYSPEGGPDPNPNERPRFFVVQALAETVSFDSVNLVTPAEPVSHAVVDGVVSSDVARFDGEGAVPVWSSSFPQPDDEVNEVARFTREMAIGNDYIYWGYGSADRVLYNGTTYNYDAFFIDPADVSFVDDSRWAEYLDPELIDVVYYDNSLEYVVNPLVNLDSDQLDITPEWREELINFKTNGHQEGLMRRAVELLFRGVADAMIGFHVTNETPATFYHFLVTDPEAFAAGLELPAGHSLAPVALLEGDAAAHYLTLSVFDVDGAVEGTRAEWSTYTETGDGRPKQLLLDLLTADVGIEPVSIINLPDLVDHQFDGDIVRTRLSSGSIEFEAASTLSGGSTSELTMDWVEAGDLVCHLNGVCDSFFYDAETLDVPVDVPSTVDVATLVTPWNEFIEVAPAAVFHRTNAQEYAVKRWYDLDVEIDELPFTGLEDATHTISGTGSLVGRVNDVVDSDYVYTGDAFIDGDELVFAIDQEITNGLGVGNIFTTGRFDLDTGTGTQTVVDCLGPALLCSDIDPGETSIYTAAELEASDSDEITWRVDLAIVLGGAFGTADSASGFTATRN